MLDTNRRELTRGSEQIGVGPQVFDLLVYLVQNREHVVSKDDLLDAVWSGRIVSESTLTSHVNAVRKAVGDTGEDQRLIRTVARKGFRFVGKVTEKETSGPGSPSAHPFDNAGERAANRSYSSDCQWSLAIVAAQPIVPGRVVPPV